MAGVCGVENPAQLGLDPSGPDRNLGLCPGVLDLEHEVTEHLTVPFDDEGGGETVRLLERGAIVLHAVGHSDEPAANRLLTSEAPRRFGVAFACRAQGEPFGAAGPLQTVERQRRWPLVGVRLIDRSDRQEGSSDAPRSGPGRPRTRPDRVLADKAYSSKANRAYLRRRKIRCTIPVKDD
jgi:hypothetical protein